MREWPATPIKRVASVRVSNVDKKSSEDGDAVRLCNYTDVYYRDRIRADQQFMEATATRDQSDKFRLEPDDVVVTKDSETAEDIGVAAYVESGARDLVCGYHLAILRPLRRLVQGRYLYWAMASTPVRDQLAVAATGVTRFGLRSESLGVAEIRLPPIAMQRVVVEHLDAETSRIDALIVRKRRMIELLHEREASAREDMVSRLASTEVVTRPVKRLVIEVDERLGGREPLALLSVSIHLGVVPRASMTDKEPRAEELMNYKVCQVGDIVLNRMRAFQGGVGCAMVSGIVSPDYTVLRPVKMNSEFLGHLFRSPWFVGEMTARLRGIGNSEQGNVRTPRINFAELGLIEIPVPPLKVQAEIAADLDGTVGHSMGLGNRLFRQIDLLVEHRQALITAAVTGQLDIPGLAA